MKLNELLGKEARDISGLNEIQKKELAMNGIEELREIALEMSGKKIEAPEGIKLNLGCGGNYINSWINVDMRGKADVIHNLLHFPYPFENETAGEILLSHVLEHLVSQGDYLFFFDFFREIHRILKKDGIARITVPNYSSSHAFGDPGHRSAFSEKTFIFLSKKVYEKNREMKTTMTQYEIPFDFDIISSETIDGEIRVVLKKV